MVMGIGSLQANPTGGNVTAGSASIAGQGTSAITVQQSSHTAIINWQTFSINSGESTTFLQPSATSATLNRVLGGQTSLINGTLTANGQIYLVNGNGIIVGPGGVVNAGAFTASTRDISNSDFLSGNLQFTGSNDNGVQNFGTINALGGNVVLIGKTVNNQGTINARNGTAGLVAGDSVLLAQKNADGSTITVNPSPLATSASTKIGVNNGGTINAAAAELKAANGNVYALAIQNSGTIRATTARHQGGHIWLTSDTGTVVNSGTLNASARGKGKNGGTVTVKNMGGITVDTGTILARGGNGGTGGNAEVSGEVLSFSGSVDLSAEDGVTGTLLLDPNTITIAVGGSGALPANYDNSSDTGDYTISPSALVTALNTANITLEGNTSITFDSTVDASGNANSHTLTLQTPDLILDAPIILVSGASLSGTATTVNLGTGGTIQNAISAAASGATIYLPATTYDLTSAISLSKDVTLDGVGLDATIFNGQKDTQIFNIGSGANVTIENVTVENGESSTAAGIYNAGTLTITDDFFTGNKATTYGGAIENINSLTVNDSTFTSNTAADGGGAIFNNGDDGNATLVINGSTFSGNTSSYYGSAIETTGYTGVATMTMTNSTLTTNAQANYGVIYSEGYGSTSSVSSVTLTNDTIIANTGGTASYATGGFYNQGGDGGKATLTIKDTILAGNTSGAGETDYGSASGTLVDNGYNLYGQGGVSGNFPHISTDILLTGSLSSVVESINGAPVLSDNGGPTQTFGLVIGSPAYLTGGAAGTVTTDQRGLPRGATISIGAYEPQGTSTPSLEVNTISDAPTLIGSTDVTLRDAIYYAENGFFPDPTITWDSDVFGTAQTITLEQGELVITGALNLTAPAAGLTINANNYSRIMEIDGNATGYVVNISGLTMINGNGGGLNDDNDNVGSEGGALLVYSENNDKVTANLSQLTITGNSAETSGGGVYVDAESGGTPTVNLSDSLISGNQSSWGCGVDNDGSDSGVSVMNITGCTITNNFVTDSVDVTGAEGAGIYNDGESGSATMTITGSTIAGNTGVQYGGGIMNDAGFGSATLTIVNSTITDNTASSYGGAILSEGGFGGNAALTVENSTLIGNSVSAGGTAGGGIYSDSNYAIDGTKFEHAGTAKVTISDTILADNTVNGSESDYAGDGTLLNLGHNLYGQNGNAGGFTAAISSDILLTGAISTVVQTNSSNIPLLADNGGPTPTFALIVDSPAYLSGGALGSVTTDQRGASRGAAISIGAYDVAPSLVVNTTSDSNVLGVFNNNDDPSTTLRQAIEFANSGVFSDPTITFDPTVFTGGAASTITLVLGEYVVDNNVTIQGGTNGVVLNANDNSRVMEIDGTASGITVNLGNLTLENGNGIGTNDSGDGGALLIYTESGFKAAVTITGSTISGNSASNGGGTGYLDDGGGIYNDGSNGGNATLTISDSTLSGNSVGASGGGGFTNDDGGGIYNDGSKGGNASVSISNSTLSGNSAGNSGGGIYNNAFNNGNATVTIGNSTLSGNSTLNNYGGAIFNEGSDYGNAGLTINNSTISGNTTTSPLVGGIFNDGESGGTATLMIGDTILAGNTANGSEADYYANNASGGTVTFKDNGYNLFGNDGQLGNTGKGDIVFSGNIDIVLAPLANYGGPTETMALIVGSPAYLAGGPVGSVTTDQRGDTRGSKISIGAWDYDPSQLSLVVNTTADTAGDIIGSTTVTLRDAIFYGEVGLFTDPTITFNTNPDDGTNFSTAQTITLAQGELFVDGSLNIDGSAVGNVTVNANNASRVMEIDGTVTVNLNNLTLENGNGNGIYDSGDGGGLLINGYGSTTNVTLTDCTISNNMVGGQDPDGAGIYNDGQQGSATLTIDNSTISGNSMQTGGIGVYGAGIYNDGSNSGNAMLTIDNSTISGNSTGNGGAGGGIMNWGDGGVATTTITDSTISGNSVGSEDSSGGAIDNEGSGGIGTVTINTSTISGNTAGSTSIGGAIYNDGYGSSTSNASVIITNSTISGNSATSGGAIYNYGEKGKSGVPTATLTITNSTISGNSAVTARGVLGGGGIYNNGGRGSAGIGATLIIGDTILAGNTSSGAESDYYTSSSTTGTLTDAGYNLYGQSGNAGGFTGTGTGDILVTGAIGTVLDPLANNGGPTETMALVTGSLALGNGNTPLAISGYTLPTTDQRGDSRTTNGALDIGAYQDQGTSVSGTFSLSDGTLIYGTSGAITLTFTPTSAAGTIAAGSLPTVTLDDETATLTLDANGTYQAVFDTPVTAGARTYDVTANFNGYGHYAAASNNTLSFTINPATLTIAASVGETKTYGQEVTGVSYPNPSYTVTGLANGDSFNGVTLNSSGYAATAGAGSYSVSASGGSGTLNAGSGGTFATDYIVTYAPATANALAVNAASLTITASTGESKTYGQDVTGVSYPNPSYTVTGLVNGDSYNGVVLNSDGYAATAGAGSYSVGTSGGTGTLNASSGGTFATDYIVTYTPATAHALTVGAATLTITASTGESKTYGQDVTGVSYPNPSYTVTGLANGDSYSGVTLNSDGYATTAGAGNYSVSTSGGSGTLSASSGGTFATDYIVTYAPATANALTVGAATLTITANTGETKTYGQDVTGVSYPNPSYTVTGLANGDSYSGVTLNSDGYAGTAGAGNYSVSTSGGSGELSASSDGTFATDYNVIYAPATANALTVGAATLTITASTGEAKTYGQDVTGVSYPNPSYTVTGLANGDSYSGVSLNSDGYAATAGAGSYSVGTSGGTGTLSSSSGGTFATDYNVVYSPATANALTVGAATLTITASIGETKTYGQDVTGVSYPNPSYTVTGLVNGDSYGGVALSSDGYAATAGAGSYSVSTSGGLGTLSANSGGTFVTDYNVIYAPATANALTVGAATLTITANTGETKTYGQDVTGVSYPNPSYTVTGLVNGDSYSGVALNSDGYAATAGAGSYSIGISGGSGTLNASSGGTFATDYNVVYATTASALTISAATLTITATTGETKIYGQGASGVFYPNPSYTVTGLVNGDSYGGVTLNSDGYAITADVGSYSVSTAGGTGILNTGSGGTFASDYNVVYAPATAHALTVNPATLTYVANPVSIYLGQPIPRLTGAVTGFVNDQTLADSTTGTLTFTTTAKASTMPGNYAIDGSGLTADNSNYVFVQALGNATALSIGRYQFGQPGNVFANFSAQFNANANYNTFFTQSWFPLFDPNQDGWLIPVFPSDNVPHPVYSNRQPSYGKEKKPKHVIGFGSSYQILGQTGTY